MKKAIFHLVSIALILSCSTRVYCQDIDKKAIETKVDQLVDDYQKLDIFSGVVLIAQDGKPFYHKAFGLADREKGIANKLNTKFDIGSMNKTFTRVVILQLVEEGKLKLKDKLSKILPEFSDKIFSKITVSHLLNHTAGFGDYYMSPGFFDAPIEEKNIESLVKRIRQMPLLFKPGTENEYSNSGYILLGAIIEKITGKSYHQNVKDRIVIPLKLNETYVEDKYNVPDRAIGYFKTMRGELMDNMEFVEVANPDGGFQATAENILRFYQEFHYGQTLLQENTKMQDEFYSMIQVHRTTGGAIPHTGGFDGANTVNYEILRDRISVVVFANMNEPVAENLGAGILAIIRGKTPEKPSLPAAESVYQAYSSSGIDYVKTHFNELITNFHPTDPKSLILNEIGYEFLFENEAQKALEIFKLNTTLFPDDANVWDSLGECYLKMGDKESALKYYNKALEIDPELPSAVEAVSKLN